MPRLRWKINGDGAESLRPDLAASCGGPATNGQRGIAGSESEFAARMSQRAREPGMSHSRFVNAWGNSSGGQRVTARDMARLAAHVISTYPQSYH